MLLDNGHRQNRGFHSEFVEPLQNSLGALNVGKSRVQAAEHMGTQEVPLIGYEDFCQELQTYPVSRELVMVQPSGPNNTNNSALLDLPNINTNLPPPLTPQTNQVDPVTLQLPQQQHQQQQEQAEAITSNQVTNSEILESMQSITKVMQQQLLFSCKTAKQGIIQTTNLFQEIIKEQEKRDLGPTLLAIPTFSGKPLDRSQCLDWVSRVKKCMQPIWTFFQVGID